MSTIKLSAIKSTTANPPTMQSQNGIERGKFCRGWVAFGRDLGDVNKYEVQSGFNVLAIADTTVGQFTIYFNNAMPTNRFAIAGTASSTNTNIMGVCLNASNTLAVPMTTTSVNIRTTQAGTTDAVPNYVCIFAYADA